MTTKQTAGTLIGGIVVVGTIIMGGLHFFAEHGQFVPASVSNGATKSDQRPERAERP